MNKLLVLVRKGIMIGAGLVAILVAISLYEYETLANLILKFIDGLKAHG